MANANELKITRLINAPVAAVWTAWTQHLAEWWCPRPWTVEIVEQDMRAGGRSAMVMKGPEGETHPQEGIFLEVIPEKSIVFTNAITVGGMPANPQPAMIIGYFAFTEEGGKTRYTAGARHWTEEAMTAHAAMGFEQGWGICADQLEAVVMRLKATANV